MPESGAQVAPQDRWAIVAYIKALQLSQDAKDSDAAPGAKVDSLANLATQQGLDASFMGAWTMPRTAIYGTPNNQDNGIPETVTPGGKSTTTKSAPAAAKKQ
jgi:hypothetical protein